MQLYDVYKYFGTDENAPEIIYNLEKIEFYEKITDLVSIFLCYDLNLIDFETAKTRGQIYIDNNNLNEAEQIIYNKYFL
jgi:hypothetical protein